MTTMSFLVVPTSSAILVDNAPMLGKFGPGFPHDALHLGDGLGLLNFHFIEQRFAGRLELPEGIIDNLHRAVHVCDDLPHFRLDVGLCLVQVGLQLLPDPR